MFVQKIAKKWDWPEWIGNFILWIFKTTLGLYMCCLFFPKRAAKFLKLPLKFHKTFINTKTKNLKNLNYVLFLMFKFCLVITLIFSQKALEPSLPLWQCAVPLGQAGQPQHSAGLILIVLPHQLPFAFFPLFFSDKAFWAVILLTGHWSY